MQLCLTVHDNGHNVSIIKLGKLTRGFLLSAAKRHEDIDLDSLGVPSSIHLLRIDPGRMKEVPPPKGGLSAKSARRVREYLREHFTEKIQVAELAAVAGVSPNHFILSFARTFGMPPHRYLINLRLDMAEQLLVEGGIAIAEIALMTGFSDQSHLSTTMKRYRGRTPMELQLSRSARF